MKQYLSVVIVFVICLLAIAGAWGWRTSQKNKKINIESLEENIQINSITPVIDVYDEEKNTNEEDLELNSTIINENSNIDVNKNEDTTLDSASSGTLTVADIKTHEGKNKSYEDIKTLMLKYAKNGASLNAEIEKVSGYFKMEYKVALDIEKASMKLVEPETSVNEYINNYLESSRTYNVEIKAEGTNIVNIIITGN